MTISALSQLPAVASGGFSVREDFASVAKKVAAKAAPQGAKPARPPVSPASPPEGPPGQAAQAVTRVVEAQQRLDKVLALANSGKTFTPAELIGLQGQVYRASQELDLVGKVVEKAVSGAKQVLQTQV